MNLQKNNWTLSIQEDASDEFKERVKEFMTVPNDALIQYFTDDEGEKGLAFTRAKHTIYWIRGMFVEKNVKPTLLTREQFNAKL